MNAVILLVQKYTGALHYSEVVKIDLCTDNLTRAAVLCAKLLRRITCPRQLGWSIRLILRCDECRREAAPKTKAHLSRFLLPLPSEMISVDCIEFLSATYHPIKNRTT